MDRSREYVNVLAHFHAVGDSSFGFDGSLETYDFIWYEGDFEDCIDEDDSTVLKPFIGFGVTTINLGNSYCSWLQHELDGWDHTILTGPDNENMDQIKRIAEYSKSPDSRFANFVIAYDMTHRCYGCDYGCDCDTEIDFVGLVDMANLAILEV